MLHIRRSISLVVVVVVAVVFGVLEAGSFLMPANAAPIPAAALTTSVSKTTTPPCNTPRPALMAHRGVGFGTKKLAGRRYTEDTVPAFKYALRVGADGFETDYSPARTGELISNHDSTLGRTTNGTGFVRNRSLGYIKQHRADSGARIPTFGGVQSIMAPYNGFRQQELKPAAWSDDDFRLMMAVDRRYIQGVYCKVLFTASEMETLQRVNKIDSSFQVGFITRSGCGRPDLSTMPSFVDVILIDSCAVSADYVTAARARGMQISARGVDSVTEYRRVVRLGVTRIVTNKPALIARNR